MSELLAGIAEVDITPPVGHRMAGHFYEVLSDGTHDPLKARAIILQQGEEKIGLAFTDVVSLSPNVTTHARQRFSQLGSLPVGNIMINATHSHTGPLYDDPRRDLLHRRAVEASGEDPHEAVYYPDFLTNRIVEALTAADNNLASATPLVVNAGQEGLSFNRRYHMQDGSVRFNPGQLNPAIVRPAGPIDPELTSLMLGSSKTGEMLGGLTVFACHADTMGGNQYSADYPFYLERTLRERFGPDYVSAFAAGTCGDINHIDVSKDGARKGAAISEYIGSTLGHTILSRDTSAIESPSLAVARTVLDIPLQPITAEDIERATLDLELLGSSDKSFQELVAAVKVLDLLKRGSSWPVEVQAFRIDGDTAIVGLPGEIFVELGLAIKAQSPFANTMITTLANDRLSYIPTDKAFGEGSYEVTNSRVMPGSGEVLVDTAVHTLQELAL